MSTTFCDTEAAIAWVLRAGVDAPVYGELPPDPPFPCVRVLRVAGAPVNTRPLYLDAAMVQVDIFAESKGLARSIADSARVLLARVNNTETPFGWLTGCNLGSCQYLTEDAFTPTKARYRFDLITWGRVASTPDTEGDTLP